VAKPGEVRIVSLEGHWSYVEWKKCTCNVSPYPTIIFASRFFLLRALSFGSVFVLLAALGCKDRKASDTLQSLDAGSSSTVPTHPTAPPLFQFVNVTKDWSVDFTYRNGESRDEFTILESLGGGVGVIDFDRDGFQDLFCPGGGDFIDKKIVGLPSELFRNLEGKKMKAVGVEAANGLIANHYSHGAFIADFDGDGFSDVLVTGFGGLQLWQNQGDGTFRECHAECGLRDTQWSSAAGWGDFDNDGDLDLYVAHYVNWSFENHPYCRRPGSTERDICPPRSYDGIPDILYTNNGDGTFTDATQQYGMLSDPTSKGLGVLIADFDGNGFVDVYVANDTTNNFYYANSGKQPFEEIATIAGVAADKAGIPNGSMGLDVIDHDQNGRPEIWVTNYEREDFALYRNEGKNAFLHVSDIMGLNVLGGLFVGFGTCTADFDLDGREDILVNNGHVIRFPTASPRKQHPILMAAKEKRFVNVAFPADSFMMEPHDGRGLALADLDQDGDLDPVFSCMNSPLSILNNRSPEKLNWLQVRLIGTRSARDAIGASVTAQIGDRKLMRIRKGGGSYMSTSQEALAWGLGNHSSVDKLTVTWPSGTQTVIENVASNQLLTIVESIQ
jgi:enediyne biosynthesis protein E4